jgi:hypothetical protein
MRVCRAFAPCGLLAAALVVCGCESLADGSKREFSRDFTCPVDRVDAQPRPDLHASRLDGRSGPPKDVAADPDRLKMWQDNEAQAVERDDSRYEIVELRGCGKHLLSKCHRFKGNRFGCTTLFHEEFPQGIKPLL